MVDQFYWGRKIYELGVGPQPIPRTRLDGKGLAANMTELVQNENLHRTAARLGEQIRSEHGAENAVRLIEETFTRIG